MGLGEDVVIEMSVASGEAMGGREGLLMGDDCLGGNEGGASSTSVTSLFGDTDLTIWGKVDKGINWGYTKTLEIKAWRDRQPKIVLNFRAVGLQGAGSGSI